MASNPSEVILSVGEVAERFGVSRKTAGRWADEGRVPCFRTPGGHRRFRESDIIRLLESLQVRRGD